MPRELRAALAPAPNSARGTSVIWALPGILLLFHIVAKLDIKIRVIGSTVAWLILRNLQVILCPWRRHSRHWLVQYGAMAAYYLPTLIVLYLAHAAISSPSNELKDVLSVGCFFSLWLSAHVPVAMTRFTLGNDPLRLPGWRLLTSLLYLVWVQWSSVRRDVTLSDLFSFVFMIVAPVVDVVVRRPEESILDRETKLLADYMMDRRSRQLPFFSASANSLYDGCKYPFMRRRADICLAYTFSRLLARCYFGFPCAEDGDLQVCEFVLTELLSDYNRAFSIVEVQLAFLHDYFFTCYHSKLITGFVSVKNGILKMLLFSSAFLILLVMVAALLVRGITPAGVVFLVASTVPLILMLLTIVMLPQAPFLPKYWHPIQNVFLHFLHPPGSPAPGPCSQQRSRRPRYWRDKLSQYSLMEDYDHRSSKETIIAWCKVHMLSQELYNFIKHHPAEGEEIRVPDTVKMLVASTLRDMNGPPTIGTRSSQGHFSWTYTEETLTHTILIWHIATWYCDMLSQSQPPETEPEPEPEPDMNREAATVLSGYCAYLLAFLPNLLPGHILMAKVVLQQVLQEIKDKLGTTRMSKEEKMTGIQTLQLPQDEFSLTTFEKGVRLGRQLEQQPDVSLRWKAMADFWAEMILYLAASDSNAAAHVEQLVQGGEFITHLWAMLSNAGILNKGTEQWTPPQQRNKPTVSREEHDAPAPQPEEKSATAFYRRTKSAKT